MMRAMVALLGLGLALVPGCGAQGDSEWSIDQAGSDISDAPGGLTTESTRAGAAFDSSTSQPVSADVPSTSSTTSALDHPAGTEGTLASGYCRALLALMELERSDGAMAGLDFETRYRTLLQAVVDQSPPRHTPTWQLFATAVDEPFSYDNFNPAVDSLDQIVAELDADCPGAGLILVDDDGRITSWLTIDG